MEEQEGMTAPSSVVGESTSQPVLRGNRTVKKYILYNIRRPFPFLRVGKRIIYSKF